MNRAHRQHHPPRRYWSIFRPDFQRVLAESAVREGVAIHYGRTVVDIDPYAGSVDLGSGREESADVIICADGMQLIRSP